jgi:enamine deaminase RidA (YjgF/YER057c/UK114 family)
VFVSGIVGIGPSTGSIAGDTIQGQCRQALTNCEAILVAGGASLHDVVEGRIPLTDPAGFAALNEEYARCFPPIHRPATSPSSVSTVQGCSSRSGWRCT